MYKNIFFITSLLFIYSAPIVSRSSSAPYISGDSFRALADHLFDETNNSLSPDKVQYKDTIFVNTDFIEQFFQNIHPYIKNKYFLITHNSIKGSPGKFKHYLDDEKILAWFGKNPTIENNKKFISIPLGIANNHWEHGNTKTFDAVLHKKYELNQTKKYLVGLNFANHTIPSIRVPVYNFFSKKHFCSHIGSRNHKTYLEQMARAKFIISPEGAGLDCHRIWEALLVGCIPIVKSSMLDGMLANLPVAIINDWQEVSEEFLDKKYKEIQSNIPVYEYEKLYFDYWNKLICHYKQILE